MRTVLLSAVVATALSGCGPGNALEGSVADQVSLEFNDVLLRKQDGHLVVQYELRSGAATQIVLKLAVLMEDLPASRELKGDDFLERVTVSRTMLDGSRLPPLLHGSLSLGRFRFEHAGAPHGSFRLLFKDQRTLSGDFGGTLVEVVTE